VNSQLSELSRYGRRPSETGRLGARHSLLDPKLLTAGSALEKVNEY
jgi:hypothetical protein